MGGKYWSWNAKSNFSTGYFIHHSNAVRKMGIFSSFGKSILITVILLV